MKEELPFYQLNIIKLFLKNRYQYVSKTGDRGLYKPITHEVTQDSSLGTFLEFHQ